MKKKGKERRVVVVILIIFIIIFAVLFILKYFFTEKFKYIDYELVGELKSIGPLSKGSGEYTCKEVYGSEYKTCPKNVAKGSEDYANCCASNEECCHKNKDVEPVCCSTKRNVKGERLYECSEFHGEVDGASVAFNYCKVKACELPRSQKCSSWLKSVCCLPKPQEYCGMQRRGYDTPFCAIKSVGCPEGTFGCYREDIGGSADYLLCCKTGMESCDTTTIGSKKFCNPYLCSYGETLCQGRGEYSWIRVCCKIGEICFHYPNDYPRCV